MDKQALLQQLRDLHLPDAIGLWPIAWGWYALALLLLLATLYLIYRKTRPKEMDVYEMATFILEKIKKIDDPTVQITALSEWFRRLAFEFYGRENTAGLCGYPWLTFLNKTGQTTAFTASPGNLLASAPYQKHMREDIANLFSLAESWLNTQKKKGNPSEKAHV